MPPLLSHAPFSFYILCLLASSMSTHLSPLWMDLFFPAGNKRMCFEAEVVFAPAALLALGSFIEGLTERASACMCGRAWKNAVTNVKGAPRPHGPQLSRRCTPAHRIYYTHICAPRLPVEEDIRRPFASAAIALSPGAP